MTPDLIDTTPGLALANEVWQAAAAAMLRAGNEHEPGEVFHAPVSPYSAPPLRRLADERSAR